MEKQVLICNVLGPWRIENSDLVAPVIMIVEGVHNGSHGPVFWAAHVLREAVQLWENIPVTLNHPEEDGKPVSVNHSEQIKQKYLIGRVTNPYFDEAKKALRATVRIRMNNGSIAPAAVQNCREVSVGVFSEETAVYGLWSGEGYAACGIAMQPDHLALLPDDIGACSWEDGCGIRTHCDDCNKQHYKEEKMEMEELLLPAGMNINEGTKIDLNEEWNKDDDVLGPIEINSMMRGAGKQRQNQDDDDDILFPTGI